MAGGWAADEGLRIDKSRISVMLRNIAGGWPDPNPRFSMHCYEPPDHSDYEDEEDYRPPSTYSLPQLVDRIFFGAVILSPDRDIPSHCSDFCNACKAAGKGLTVLSSGPLPDNVQFMLDGLDRSGLRPTRYVEYGSSGRTMYEALRQEYSLQAHLLDRQLRSAMAPVTRPTKGVNASRGWPMQ